ncbi:MAG: TonB-dependent receptor [Mediterranea sp.]|jgi:iron complex outermembrane receptor protein|nr:TonB-dependent receptor [Mediterranea sp.]
MKQFNLGICRMILPFLTGIFLSFGAYAQQITVKGHVKDSTGEPVIGANVLLKGTSVGTITDFDGNFILNAHQNALIEISFIGYKTVEVRAAATIDVTLEDDAVLLDEAVVIGYGTVKKSDATGSLMAIDADKMVKGMATSASDLLVGKAAGVSVITDGGAPGAGATIRVRGGSSMSASNDPLIVIDGVPVDNGGINGMANPLSTVHPNDIATFTILKDASATAIYGSRASNGVIIITTKKGKEGRTNVSYNGTFSVSTKTKTVDVMGTDEFRLFVADKYGAGSNQAAALGNASTDWQDEIFSTAYSTDHNVSVSGALSNLPFRVSVGYTNENGILRTSNLERFTGAINLNPKFFNNKLDLQLNVKGVYNPNRFADTGAIGMASQFDPTQPVHMEGSQYGNGYYMALANGTPIGIALSNPMAMLEQKNDKSKVYRSIGNAQADYRFGLVPGLRANLNLGYDIAKSEGDVTIADNSPMTWSSGNYKEGWGENSTYYQLKRNLLLDFYLNYAKVFGDHNVDVMAGYSWQHFYSSTKNTYPYSDAMAAKSGKIFYKEGDDYATENYLVSFFGRLNYTLLNRYLLTFTLRNDGSSRFSKDSRWGLFPSAALGWKINEEAFLRDVDCLSDLKLRLGYGVTGQQNLNNGDYPYLARYMTGKAGASYFFGDTQYELIAPLAYDKNLKWEETTTWNVGVDYGFLNGRITGALDVYYRKTEDLLNTVAIAAGTNFNNQLLTNVGTLENKGVELSVNAHVLTTKDWDWTVGYNISYNKNEITKMTINDDPNYVGVIFGGIDGGTGYNIMINSVNHPYNSFYVFEQVYNKDGKPIEGAYVDHNGDGKVGEKDNDGDLIAYKKSAPDVFMGLTSQLSYKNWDLSFALRASIGNYAYNNVQSNREAWGGSEMYDNTGFLKNRIASASYTDFYEARRRSSYYVQNASFLRMDNISLGYTFEKIFTTKQNARVYVTVQNPFVITKYDGIDPEISGSGIDNNIYPRPRVFMLGLNLNF